MNEFEIDKAIKTLRIPLSREENIYLWLNTTMLCVVMWLIGSTSIETVRNNQSFPTLIIILLLLAVGLIYRTITINRLKVWKTDLTEDQFKEANIASATLNHWQILENGQVFIAFQHSQWAWAGIRITSILKEGKLYINSMIIPVFRSTPFSFGNNRKNRFGLIKQYQQILKGANVMKLAKQEIRKREAKFWNESELSPKNLSLKLISYPLAMGFSGIAIWLISSLKIMAIINGIILLGFVGKYIHYEWKIISEKRRRKQEK